MPYLFTPYFLPSPELPQNLPRAGHNTFFPRARYINCSYSTWHVFPFLSFLFFSFRSHFVFGGLRLVMFKGMCSVLGWVVSHCMVTSETTPIHPSQVQSIPPFYHNPFPPPRDQVLNRARANHIHNAARACAVGAGDGGSHLRTRKSTRTRTRSIRVLVQSSKSGISRRLLAYSSPPFCLCERLEPVALSLRLLSMYVGTCVDLVPPSGDAITLRSTYCDTALATWRCGSDRSAGFYIALFDII